MKTIKGKIKEDSDRDVYWTRIIFESEDGNRKTKVLAIASWEYFLDSNRISEVKDVHREQWMESVMNKWESLGDSIFDKKVHYDVYANTDEGRLNGLEFLKKINASE
jgi:hypothetical protein